MTITFTLILDDGTQVRRKGYCKSVTEFANPATKKAYGMDLSVIFDDFKPSVIKPQGTDE